MENDRVEEIKQKVNIPDYFRDIVLPQKQEYYNDYIADLKCKPVIKCCIHDENTPSFRYYEETNTFFCFGCRAGGDVINLHRKFIESMTGILPSFKESVEFLYKYFVEGKESQEVVELASIYREDYKSNPGELVRFAGYISKLEGQLLIDNSIEEYVKEDIWGLMDTMSILVSKNKVNAVEGVDYIKHMVKEKIK